MRYLEGCALYYKKSCQSCQSVLSLMDSLGIRMRTCDISHPGHLKDLISLTGRRTVPCLIAHGNATHGEREVIRAIRAEAFGYAPASKEGSERDRRHL